MGCWDLLLDIEDLTAGSVSSDSWKSVFIKGTDGRQGEYAGVLSLRKQLSICGFLPQLSVHQECGLACPSSSHHMLALSSCATLTEHHSVVG